VAVAGVAVAVAGVAVAVEGLIQPGVGNVAGLTEAGFLTQEGVGVATAPRGTG